MAGEGLLLIELLVRSARGAAQQRGRPFFPSPATFFMSGGGRSGRGRFGGLRLFEGQDPEMCITFGANHNNHNDNNEIITIMITIFFIEILIIIIKTGQSRIGQSRPGQSRLPSSVMMPSLVQDDEISCVRTCNQNFA